MKRLQALAYPLIPLLILAVMEGMRLAQGGFRIDAAAIRDTDTQMRLAYIRGVILPHGWQGGFWLRDNAPYGAVLHWTRPFHSLVITLYHVFSLALPPQRALVYAGYFTGPLLAAAACLAVWWAMRPLLSRPLAVAAALAVVLCNNVAAYDQPGTANHHALLLIEFVIVAGFAIRLAGKPDSLSIAIGAGLAAAFAVWTSFEMLVLAGLLFAFVFYLWGLDGKPRDRQVLAVATAFCALVMAAVLVDPPYGGLRVLAFDHPSLPLLGFAAVPVIVALLCRPLPKLCWHARFLFLGVMAVAALGGWAWLFEGLLGPAMQHMDPAVATEMHPTIAEMMPIRRLWSSFALIGNGIAGLAAGAILLPRNRYYLPLVGFLAVFALASREHLRFAGYFWVAGTFVAACCLQRWQDRKPGIFGMATVAAGAVLLVVFCQGVGMTLRNHSELAREPVKACQVADVAAALNDEAWLQGGDQPVFANDFEMTPGLLYWTRARTIAGYYHRDIPGVADLLSILRDNSPGDGLARGLANDHGVRFVLVCPHHSDANFAQASLALYRKAVQRNDTFTYGPPTLYNRLSDGHAPSWLTPRPWPEGTKTDLRLYQVNGAP